MKRYTQSLDELSEELENMNPLRYLRVTLLLQLAMVQRIERLADAVNYARHKVPGWEER